jgi:hypothetical protein
MNLRHLRARRDAHGTGSLLETSGVFPAEGTPGPGRSSRLPSSHVE